MFELPSTSIRCYHGKYPNRVHSISYSDSPAQRFIGEFLGIVRPVHLELNCGRRFIAAMKELKANEPMISRDISHITVQGVTPIEPLSKDRYEEMLDNIRIIRETKREA
jgi:hypothetical protein